MKKRIIIAIFVGLLIANGYLGLVANTAEAGQVPVNYIVYLGTMSITGGQSTWTLTATASNIVKTGLHVGDKINFYVKCNIVNDPPEMIETWKFVTNVNIVGVTPYSNTFQVSEYPPMNPDPDHSGLRTILVGTLTIQKGYLGTFNIQCYYYNTDWSPVGNPPVLRASSPKVTRTITLVLA